jgi:hypothetical protein
MKNLLFVLIVIGITFSACKKGDTGAAGKDGNANVKSYTLTVKSTDWTSFFGSYVAYPKLTAITDSVLNYGTVMLYYKSGNAWYALPALNYHYAINRSNDNPGYIALVYESATAPTTDATFRAVVITGVAGTVSASIKKMSYEQVKTFYGLEE